MNLRQKIEFLMTRNDITKAQMSKDLDIPYTTIDSILKRNTFENVKFSMLKKLCEYFNVDMRYLCYDEITDSEYGKNCISSDNPLLSKNQNQLTNDEQELLTDYRSLSAQGKESIRQQMFMHVKIYKVEATHISDVDVG